MKTYLPHVHGLEDYIVYAILVRISISFFVNQQADSKIHIKIQRTLNRKNNFDKEKH